MLQGKPVQELRRALETVSTEQLLEAAVEHGLMATTLADNTTTISPEVVAELVIAGLKAPQGSPGADAPAPPGQFMNLIK